MEEGAHNEKMQLDLLKERELSGKRGKKVFQERRPQKENVGGGTASYKAGKVPFALH